MNYGGEFTNNVYRLQEYESLEVITEDKNKRTQNKRFKNLEISIFAHIDEIYESNDAYRDPADDDERNY
jgi:hypothetical protein